MSAGRFQMATRWLSAAHLTAILLLSGCWRGLSGDDAVKIQPPMPPNTILLSQMMRELSDQPGFTEAILDQVSKNSKTGAALLTPELVDHLRSLIVGKDWSGLDRFPGWTMGRITPVVSVGGHVAGQTVALPDGSTIDITKQTPPLNAFVDLGPYDLAKDEAEDLDKPSNRPPFTDPYKDGLQAPIAFGVVRGDPANPELAPLHPESVRLSQLMNRLALNGTGRSVDKTGTMTATLGGDKATTPEDLIRLLIASGHSVTVADARYFANFQHMSYKGQDIMMPFWIDTGYLVPGTGGLRGKARKLLVPVSHTEYEWTVRGPAPGRGINANICFYYGIDGKAQWRVMDQRDQPWVMGRHAHEYTGAQAIEATRLVGRMVVAFMHQHINRPTLPFGGYYALGVCQDGIAAVELKMTGHSTLFPNTADASLFDDPRDAEINDLYHRIPKDRSGKAPGIDRVFATLPTGDVSTIAIPGLAADLVATQAAWKNGTLLNAEEARSRRIAGAVVLGLLAVALAAGLRWRRRSGASSHSSHR